MEGPHFPTAGDASGSAKRHPRDLCFEKIQADKISHLLFFDIFTLRVGPFFDVGDPPPDHCFREAFPMRKIALIKYRSLSYVNDHVIDILRRSFPEYPLEVIDIEKLFLKKGRGIILKNIFLTV